MACFRVASLCEERRSGRSRVAAVFRFDRARDARDGGRVQKGLALEKAKSYAPAAAKFEAVVAVDADDDLGWYQPGRGEPSVRSSRSRHRRVQALHGSGAEEPDCVLRPRALPAQDRRQSRRARRADTTSRSRRRARRPTRIMRPRWSRSRPPAAAPKPAGAPGGDAAARPAPPSPGNAAYVEAQALRDRGQIEESIAKFKQAIAADPRHSAARTALGELLLKIQTRRRGDHGVARGRRKNPTYSLAWYDLAFALRARNQHAPAVDAYDTTSSSSPATRIRTTASAVRSSTSAASPTPGARSSRICRLEKRPSEQHWVESAEGQLRTLTASAK